MYKKLLAIAISVFIFLIFRIVIFQPHLGVKVGNKIYLTCDHNVPTERTIHIAMGCDDGYVPHMATTIASVLLNCDASSKFCFHILDGGISESNKQKILNLNRIRPFEIDFYDMKSKFDWSIFPDGQYVTLATYYRLMIQDVVPSNIEKMLYLDGDMIIEDDLKKIWDIDISDYVLAAVEDEESAEHANRLNLHKNYFNGGVLLLNLSKLRKKGLMRESVNYLEKNRQAIRYYDQDILNGLFSDCCKFIDLRWNVNSSIYIGNRLPHFYTKSAAEVARKNPAIIHYTGSQAKPWRNCIIHPMSGEYFKYMKYTDFKLSALAKIHLFFYETSLINIVYTNITYIITHI